MINVAMSNGSKEALSDEGFEVRMELPVLRQMPQALRDAGWNVTAVIVGDELIGIEPGDTTDRSFGLAFDIGTTTVVGALMDLRSGVPLAIRSTLNAQAIFGADVISRISHAMMNDSGLAELAEKISLSMNSVIEQLLAEASIPAREVYEVVVAGNATMLHLLMGIDPTPIGVEPFIPTIEDPLEIKSADIGLRIHQQAKIHCLPHLGAYVGADLVGGLMATGLAQEEGVRLLVDVGTNGEIILGSVARTVATAAPAGPAFEGAQIKSGMRASDGAIEAVTISSDSLELQVIGDVPPIGLCGSGLLDAVAQLRLSGLLIPSGRFIKDDVAAEEIDPELAKRLITDDDGNRAFVLAVGTRIRQWTCHHAHPARYP